MQDQLAPKSLAKLAQPAQRFAVPVLLLSKAQMLMSWWEAACPQGRLSVNKGSRYGIGGGGGTSQSHITYWLLSHARAIQQISLCCSAIPAWPTSGIIRSALYLQDIRRNALGTLHQSPAMQVLLSTSSLIT